MMYTSYIIKEIRVLLVEIFMEENVTETSFEILKQQKEIMFQTDYLKSKPFKSLINEILETFVPKYIKTNLLFELTSQMADKIRTTPEIYNNYTKSEKTDLKIFQKRIKHVIHHINKANDNLLKVCEFINK